MWCELAQGSRDDREREEGSKEWERREEALEAKVAEGKRERDAESKARTRAEAQSEQVAC